MRSNVWTLFESNSFYSSLFSISYFFFIHPPTSFVSFPLRFISHDMLINDMSWSTFVHYLSLLTSSPESFHILFSPKPQDQFQPVTKHPLFKRIQTCLNDGSRHLPRVNNSDIEEKPRLFPREYKWKNNYTCYKSSSRITKLTFGWLIVFYTVKRIMVWNIFV